MIYVVSVKQIFWKKSVELILSYVFIFAQHKTKPFEIAVFDFFYFLIYIVTCSEAKIGDRFNYGAGFYNISDKNVSLKDRHGYRNMVPLSKIPWQKWFSLGGKNWIMTMNVPVGILDFNPVNVFSIKIWVMRFPFNFEQTTINQSTDQSKYNLFLW